MRLVEIRLDLADGEAQGAMSVEFGFPFGQIGASGKVGAKALLSLRGAGSMRYFADSPSPGRLSFFGSLGLDPSLVVATELHHTRRLRLIEMKQPMPPLPGRVGELDAGDLAGEDMGDGGPDEASGRDGILLCPTGSPTEGGRGRLAAAVTVADCMPIWILDRLSGAYGLLHSGWKGTGILRHAITALVERCSADPASISVILGPAIGPCCYEVPPERARAFDREFGAASVDWSGEKPRIDLRAANIALAR